MELAENSGGDCDQQSPWCGYELSFDGTALIVTSRTTPDTGTGTLTSVGRQRLDALVGDVPYDTPDDPMTTCANAPIVRLHVRFDEVGPRTFQYACEPGDLAALGGFVTQIANAVINFESDDMVVVDAPF